MTSLPTKQKTRSIRKTRSAPSRYNSFKLNYSEKAIIFNAILFLKNEFLLNPAFSAALRVRNVNNRISVISLEGLFKLIHLIKKGGIILEMLGIKKIPRIHGPPNEVYNVELTHIISERLTPSVLIAFFNTYHRLIWNVTLTSVEENEIERFSDEEDYVSSQRLINRDPLYQHLRDPHV